MKVIQIIIIVLTILFLTNCSRGYKIEDGKVYYKYWNEGSGQGRQLIEEADANTFQKLSIDCDCSFEFGKDKNYLFIDGKLIKNIDPNTFKFVGNYIFRDKDSAYFYGFYNDLNDCVIKGINPNKLQLIKYPWAKAGNILIHGADTLYVEDINDFIPIDKDWGKSKKNIIYKNQILLGADVETFKITNSYSGKDKNYNYEFGFINEDYFKESSYRTFDFDKKDLCEYEPIEFVDIYDKLEPFIKNQNERIEIVEKLKLKGYTIKNIKLSNRGESKIISVSLTNNMCNCYVEKLYNFDYSQPSDTGKVFKVTERIHCKPK